jgi:hypothetical protein
MLKMKKILIFIFISSFALHAQTWTGATSSNWNTSTNWSTGVVPTATSNVTIPSSLTIYPLLQADVTVNGIIMAPGSSLDFNGKKLTVATLSGFYNDITGATLNNTLINTDIVLEINTGTGGYNSTFNSNTINDNITLNLSNSNSFYEGTVAPKNIYNGNTTFNISGTMSFQYAFSVKSETNGNLIINRTTAGNTNIFNGGGIVTGNFSFSNLRSYLYGQFG